MQMLHYPCDTITCTPAESWTQSVKTLHYGLTVEDLMDDHINCPFVAYSKKHCTSSKVKVRYDERLLKLALSRAYEPS